MTTQMARPDPNSAELISIRPNRRTQVAPIASMADHEAEIRDWVKEWEDRPLPRSAPDYTPVDVPDYPPNSPSSNWLSWNCPRISPAHESNAGDK